MLLADDYLDGGDVSLFCAFANDLGVDSDVLDFELAVAESLGDDFRHVDSSANCQPSCFDGDLTGLSELDERAHGVAHDRLLADKDVVWHGGPLALTVVLLMGCVGAMC